MFYKVVKNLMVVDVFNIAVYVKYTTRNKLMIRCKQDENPNGILSSDLSCIWHVEGLEPFPVDGYETVKLVEIDEEEYSILKAALDENREVIEPEPEPIPEPEPEPEEEVPEEPQEPTEEDITDANTLEMVRSAKLSEMDRACTKTIQNGFDATLSDGGTYHFSLNITDQLNISSLNTKALAGESPLPYHADGQPCRFYPAEDIILINRLMEELIILHTTYFNSLKTYINALDNIKDIGAVYYGVDIPQEHQSEVLKVLMGGDTND